MNDKFLKPYDPTSTEDKIYKLWEESGYFNPDNLPRNEKTGRFTEKTKDGTNNVFSIVLPPPNVTGSLHMGSALMLAIEDIIVRYARMSGKKTLWIPGTDHAAIATQSKVEKEILKKEGKSRYDLGREELLKRIDIFAKESHDTIVTQMRKMGCSVDWSREAFTLDDKRNLAVRTAFKKMYDDGLIYRGYRIVNWDPKGQTTISDDEIVYESRKTKLYTFKYSKDIPISISTTRPETKLGDTAIAVNPKDERYQKYIGREFTCNFAGESLILKVIVDENVDMEFGTGALGVTPAHSIIDWEMAQKNNLPVKSVINEYAKMMVGFDKDNAPSEKWIIRDKKVTDARIAVVDWLKSTGLLEKEEDIEHNISLAERTGGVIEPLPKLQWFVAVNKPFKHTNAKGVTREVTLKQLMKEAIDSGETVIVPERFARVYHNWIDNLRDWCISRQIWYGHRIPVWYKKNSNGEVVETYCDINAPKAGGWIQDEDTLDTWFSSGLWTFSTLGWPDHKEFDAHRMYHPTTVLETGWDILFFWVARIILFSQYLLGEAPFRTVYLHGLVRNQKGEKISKSLGNNVEPLEMIAKYGADAVRMALIVNVGPGNDSKISEEKIKAYKLFANKLWNISRFVYSLGIKHTNDKNELLIITNIHDMNCYDSLELRLVEKDRELLKRLKDLKEEYIKEMNEFKFYLVGDKIYQYVWKEFADVILEETKKIMASTDEKAKQSRLAFLAFAHREILSMLHPFMPFVSEEIWGDNN